MPQPPLFVSREAFRATMRRLLANFDPHYPDERAPALEGEYRRLFTDSGPLGDAPQDDLLKQAIDWIVDHREERGMPRVAELRAALDPLIEGERMQRAAQDEFRRQRDLEERLRRERARG